MRVELKKIIRHISGYLVGIGIFMIAAPFGLFLFIVRSRVYYDGSLMGEEARTAVSAVMLAAGAVFAAWSNLYLFFVGRGGPADGFGISISPRSEKLVVTGPYRFTRNPMVFGAYMLYFAEAVYLDSPAGIILVAAFVVLSACYLRLSEEKRLLRDFGSEYEEYRRRVSMIFPFPPKKGRPEKG